MKLFVGLGNPGAQYARHRHNVGFVALDRIAAAHNLGPWRKRFQGETSRIAIGLLLTSSWTFTTAPIACEWRPRLRG